MRLRLGHILIGASVIVAATLCVGAIVIFAAIQAMFPDVPSYTSAVSPQADAGAARIVVPYCDPNPRICEGFVHFYRDGRLLIYHDYEGMVAIDPETGTQLWRVAGEFRAISGLALTEFDGGAYAYAQSSGQIVDLTDGRIALQACDSIYGAPQRMRGAIFRVECNRALVLADLQSGRIEPYASPRSDGVETEVPQSTTNYEPGWYGPVDQNDDGTLALWFSDDANNYVALISRNEGLLWRASLTYRPISGRIDTPRRRVLVRVNGEELALAIRDGHELGAEAIVPSEEREDAANTGDATIYDYRPSSERLPGEWYDLEVSASEDYSVVARYQVQVPPGGLRRHRGGHWGSDSLEGGARRLIVTRHVDGTILLERPMEVGPTATAGHRASIALAANGRRLALLPTDGVLRIYEVPATAGSD